MGRQLYCGDPICKKPVEVTKNDPAPWPIRCGSCGIALYPSDVLEQSQGSELEPRRGQLMTEHRGSRVAITSEQLLSSSGQTAKRKSADVDRLLAMVDTGQSPPSASPRRTKWIVLTAVVVATIAAVLIFIATP